MNKNGSYIAEAAIALPIVIFAIITVILAVMFFYEQSVEESRMHIALRCQAGQITEKCTYYIDGFPVDAAAIWKGDISVNNAGLHKNVTGQANISMLHQGLLRSLGTRRLSGSWLIIDPTKR